MGEYKGPYRAEQIYRDYLFNILDATGHVVVESVKETEAAFLLPFLNTTPAGGGAEEAATKYATAAVHDDDAHHRQYGHADAARRSENNLARCYLALQAKVDAGVQGLVPSGWVVEDVMNDGIGIIGPFSATVRRPGEFGPANIKHGTGPTIEAAVRDAADKVGATK